MIPRVPTKKTPVWAVIALVVVVTVVVLLILTFVVVLPSLNDRGSGDTPTSAMNGLWDDLNDGDIAAALEHTTLKFKDPVSYSDWYEELDDELESLGDYHFAVSDIVVTYSDDMAIDAREECAVFVAAIEEMCNITIDDFCLLEYTLYTTSTSTVDHYGYLEMFCVLVDGNWYVVLE